MGLITGLAQTVPAMHSTVTGYILILGLNLFACKTVMPRDHSIWTFLSSNLGST